MPRCLILYLGDRDFQEKDLLIWRTIIIEVMMGVIPLLTRSGLTQWKCSPTLAAGKGGGDTAPARCLGTPVNRDSTLDTWLLRFSLVPVEKERENGKLSGRDFRGRPRCGLYHSAHMPLARTQ